MQRRREERVLVARWKLRRELLVVKGNILQVGSPCGQTGDASSTAGAASRKKLKQIVDEKKDGGAYTRPQNNASPSHICLSCPALAQRAHIAALYTTAQAYAQICGA